jgi:hypothetical protein
MSGTCRILLCRISAVGLAAVLLVACTTSEHDASPLPALAPPTRAPEAPVLPCPTPATVALPHSIENGEWAEGRTRLHAVTLAEPAERSLELIETGTACARAIVAVAAEPLGVLAVAAQLAAGEGLPLLVLPAVSQGSIGPGPIARSRAILEQFGVREVLTFGPITADVALALPVGVEVVDVLRIVPMGGPAAEAPRAAARALAARWRVEVVEADPADVERLARAVARGHRDQVLMLVDPSLEEEAQREPEHEVAATALRPSDILWLGDVRDPVSLLLAASVAGGRGEAFATIDGHDPRRGVERTALLRQSRSESAAEVAVLVGAVGDDTPWQLATVLDGTPLPGERFLPLDERRIIALYGAPGYRGLGALGQQDLEATIERARALAGGYADSEMEAVAGLDLIVTIASAEAGPRGDYSRRLPIAEVRPLVERAGEEGFIVFLDLQPGRTSFLEQAQEYEELLLLPHVGLALDPEWRLGPNEVHLRRIGSVEADEVQAVIDWLAALVRRELLPQKVLVLHQFTLDMLRDRDTLEVPPELVGVIHVDGQGSLPAKYRTYAVMSEGAEDRWLWGWKNFLQIDRPLATPEQVLALDPVARVITYQ